MSTSNKRKSSAAKRDAIDRPFDPTILKTAKATVAQYQVVVWHDVDEETYCGKCVELPLVLGTGDDPNACIKETRALAVTTLATMLEMGQPAPTPIQVTEERTEQINVRLTPREKQKISSNAARKGFKGLSEYLRAAALSGS